MNKENKNAARVEEPIVRITRARAKAFGISGEVAGPSKPVVKQGQKRALRANSKTGVSDENKASVVSTIGLQHKRRAVLKDVSNSNVDWIDASQVQV